MRTNIVLLATLVSGASACAQLGTAIRELPYDFHPGDLVGVRIQVTPPPGTTHWTIRERYPNRWDLVTVTNASSTNEFIGELGFGPFTNDAPRTLYYEILSVPGLTNSVTFSGEVAFNLSANFVAGTTFFPARNEWLFDWPQSLTGVHRISGTAYGAGRWLASVFGWVSTIESDGRLTYPRGVRQYGDGWSRLAYVGGLFFLFGSGDQGAQISISDDGLSWKTAQREPGDPHLYLFGLGSRVISVTYGNGTYVAAAYQYYYPEESHDAGAIYRSTNGYHWRRVFRLLPSRPISAVTFADGRFMAVAQRGTLLTSTNGASTAPFSNHKPGGSLICALSQTHDHEGF